jgi:uncharacterized protein (DUF433 family)/RNA polymerase subunit RPABC4/transcription elongation factor Spt4
MKKIQWDHFIHCDPNVPMGKPVVKGTRLSVEFILGLYAEGWTEDQILENCPDLTKESLLAVFAYTSDCLEAPMTKQNNKMVQCADCRKHRPENEPLCPYCGSDKRRFDEEVNETLNITDYSTASIPISASKIDIPSATMATATTLIPKSIIEAPKEEGRDLAVSNFFLEKNQDFEGVKDKLPEILADLIEGRTDSYISRSGDGNKVLVFNNCNIYGSAIGEKDVHSEGMTFVQEWNSLQNTLDIENLRDNLVLLRKELIKRAKTDPEFEAVNQVSMALDDLKKANGPTMLRRLRNCGTWVLDVAKDIGVSVVSKLIEGKLGGIF